jgi:ABC-2 type transport system permease protein
MMNVEMQAIYVMWLRQMKRFVRSKSRIVVTIVQPLLFLFILGSGFRNIQLSGLAGIPYIYFFAPGIITMAIVFSSMFTGISVLWDKQFGFLQEVLVAPISRLSIIIGRTLGGASVALVQGFVILAITILLGTPISGILGIIMTLIFMMLIAFTAVGLGLIFASKMNDFQSFPIIMNLIMMPLLFLSSAFFPVADDPTLLAIAHLDPLFYMVDGLRGSLIGTANVLPPLIDMAVVFVLCFIMLGIGSYSFSKSEA